MRLPESRQIGEHHYAVMPLPAGMGLRVFAQVMKTAGPALAGIRDLRSLKVGDMASVFGDLIQSIDGDVLVDVCAKLAPMTTFDNGNSLAKVFDLHFQGDYLSLFEWLKFSLEVNYGPLLVGLMARVKAPEGSATPAPSQSKSQDT